VPGGAVSAKYSPGGLVDVEYFVQVRQTAVGHLDPGVRVTNTLDGIDRLAQGGHLRPERAKELREAYGFLRRLIDALRAVRGNARDLTIPATDDREFAYLARRLEFDSPSRLDGAIATWMGLARSVWDDGVPVSPWRPSPHRPR
jgi:glutamate-ammonia-ligase adenylyltransferase